MLRQQRVHNIEGMFHLLDPPGGRGSGPAEAGRLHLGPEASTGEHPAPDPLSVDPPKHVKYRRILDPLFAPKHMALLDGEVTELVNQIMDGFAGQGVPATSTRTSPCPCPARSSSG